VRSSGVPRIGAPSGPPPASPISLPQVTDLTAAQLAASGGTVPAHVPTPAFPGRREERPGSSAVTGPILLGGPASPSAGTASPGGPPSGPESPGASPATGPMRLGPPGGAAPGDGADSGPGLPDSLSRIFPAAAPTAPPSAAPPGQRPGRQGPVTQPTHMFRAYDPGSAGLSPPETVREARMDREPDRPDRSAGPSLVRPYARTGGRTKPGRHLDLEALVRTTVSGREAWSSPLLTPEHTSVIELCSGTVSVAEIAARLAVPLGVARVIIADMVDLGLVEVMKTSANNGDERDPAFLRRVLSGLQRL